MCEHTHRVTLLWLLLEISCEMSSIFGWLAVRMRLTRQAQSFITQNERVLCELECVCEHLRHACRLNGPTCFRSEKMH